MTTHTEINASTTYRVTLTARDESLLTPTELHAEGGQIVATWYDGTTERYEDVAAYWARTGLVDGDDAADARLVGEALDDLEAVRSAQDAAEPTCCYEGCTDTDTATEHDCDGDLACPLHAARSERYVVVEDLDDGSWLDEASAERAESILDDAGWTVTIRRPRRNEIEGTYLVTSNGLQILGHSIPRPESLSHALREAAEKALNV